MQLYDFCEIRKSYSQDILHSISFSTEMAKEIEPCQRTLLNVTSRVKVESVESAYAKTQRYDFTLDMEDLVLQS